MIISNLSDTVSKNDVAVSEQYDVGLECYAVHVSTGVIVIGASLSEPHTGELVVDFELYVCMYVCMYVTMCRMYGTWS